MLKKIDGVLSIIMYSCIGVFIGNAVYVYLDYKKHSERYTMWSAPWYTSIITYGAVTAIEVLLIMILKWIVKRKLRKIN
ncbi:MAG: hypothetical protein MSG78_04915 [Clostridiales bacterium]|nr:hypothetical protein [Clostridiales bacterium]